MRNLSFFLVLVFMSSTVFAHGALHDQISELSHQIEHQPGNAELYLKRGRVYLEDGSDAAAEQDFKLALHLDQKTRSAHYFLAQLALKQTQLDEALKQAQQFIASLSDEAGGLSRGYRLLGEIHSAYKQYAQAAPAYQSAIDYAAEPRPDFYTDLADAHIQQGNSHYNDALSVLEKGMQKLGPLPLLQDKAVQVHLAVGRYDAAIRQIDNMIEQGQRLPELYQGKARILRSAGRHDEAKITLQIALNKLEQIPPARQNTEAMKTLRATIVAGMQ